jgi:integrase
LHKATGQAAVTINGKHLYLGEYGSPKSRERYHQEVAKWVANHGAAPPELDPAAKFIGINNVIKAYLAFAEKYYLKPSGKKSSEVACLVAACEPLIDLFGTENAREFGPKKLKLVREHMIAKGWSRNTINKAIDRIKRMFRWATEEEFLAPDVHHGLQAVAGLKFGRTSAKESQPIVPVAEEHVNAILPYLTPQVADMLRLLMLTGMRPGEVVTMRPCDIDQSQETWIYEPAEHKNKYRGHRRTIPLGPRARKVVSKYLDRPTESCLFSPAEADKERSKMRRANRKSQLTPSQTKRRPKENGGRRPTYAFKNDSLRRAVTYGIAAANKVRDESNQIPDWHPNQIRHAVGTRIRARSGLEAAQVVLGHKHAAITETYAETSQAKAVELARKMG